MTSIKSISILLNELRERESVHSWVDSFHQRVENFKNKFNLTSVFLLTLPHININFDIDL